jgi:cellulose synthase/poly-beta-1,6-N-acetylglucosamine synthase-like glycosyltransferase
VPIVWNLGPFGGPVAAMNWYLDKSYSSTEVFAKIDNDRIVPPGWLGDMVETLTRHPDLDALGAEPHEWSAPVACPASREVTPTGHIGGVGLIRRRIFNICRPTPNGRFGWSEYQGNHPDLKVGWVTPDLPLFGLDQIPLEPWASLREEYIERGWMRRWPEHERAAAYYGWWAR